MHGYHARVELRRCWDENLHRDLGINRDAFKKHFISDVFVNEVLLGTRDLHCALTEVLPMLGYNGDAQEVIDYWLRNDSYINQDLLQHVTHLSANADVSLYIATNQERNRALYLMDELGLGAYFKDIYCSGRIGYMKPHAAYYEYVANDLGLTDRDHIILFDDRQAVVDGARAAGWEAHQFDEADDVLKSEAVRRILTA